MERVQSKNMLRTIFQSRINVKHLSAVTAISIILTYIILNYLAMGMLWAVNDGMDVGDWFRCLYIGYFFSAIIILYPLILYRMWANYKKGRLPEAKSFLIALIVVLIIDLLLTYKLLVYGIGAWSLHKTA